MNIGKMMQQAKKMQDDMKAMQAEMATLEVYGDAGGGMVKVMMTGDQMVRRVDIDASLWEEHDKGLIEDLMAAAVNQASAKVAEMQKDEPKRWQAHYDFAVACVKARLAYMNEYNKILGTIVTETLPTRDEKLGQDGYLLVASETLKSGKDVKKLAEEAQEAFQEIAVKYKGTPWAIQAKQEKSVVLGLNWKAASLKKE